MKNFFYSVVLIFSFIFMYACESDYRPMSIGAVDEIYVIMDSTQWDSEAALAIEETFGKAIETVPSYEPTYRLTFKDFSTNKELDEIRKYKNVIFASTVNEDHNVANLIKAILSDEVEERVISGESFAFPLEDRWVRDQWTLILTSTTDTDLSEKIRNSEESLVGNLLNREFDRRLQNIYRRGEQTDISDSLWANQGWSIRMQHDYIRTVQEEDATVFRRYLPENDRWIMAWWQDDIPNSDFVDADWINATRDSLLQKYMRGERDESYLTTEYRREVITKEINRDDRFTAFETLGTWTMTNDFMGGPFVNFVYHDPQTERLFMIEYGQFAPSVAKRRFVRQFRAMGRTFQSDSTWNQSAPPSVTEEN